jgi:hypothetical protein
MTESFAPVTINFGAVKVAGGPGLSLIAIVVAIAFEFPEARWLLLSGVVGGLMLAAAMIAVRRRRSLIPQRHDWIDAARH